MSSVKIAVIGISGQSIFMNIDHFHQKGETVICDSIYEEPGGKGYNQSVAAKRFGAEVSFLSAVGNDLYGNACEKRLIKEGVKPYLIRKNSKTSLATILVDKRGENKVTEYLGAALYEDDVANFESVIKECDLLLLQSEVLTEVNNAAVKLANKYNVKVIFNPAPAKKLGKIILNNVWLLTPNEQESKSIDLSKTKRAVITLGEKGCMVIENDKKLIVPAIKVKATDTTGAGDVFNAALAVKLAMGESFTNAAKFANIASGLSVTERYVLNSIPSLDKVNSQYNKVQ